MRHCSKHPALSLCLHVRHKTKGNSVQRTISVAIVFFNFSRKKKTNKQNKKTNQKMHENGVVNEKTKTERTKEEKVKALLKF